MAEPRIEYYSAVGPEIGPVTFPADYTMLAVFSGPPGLPGSVDPVGTAEAAGVVAHRRFKAVAFHLVVNSEPVPGTWVCESRRFVRVDRDQA